ncbi:MAG: helix-turn-helix transcriptional regulator [Ignavibacteriae bacterium]|nr:helix-turn-helix transcriptional regulator [Ignavibacteriota bacterium]
MRKNRPANLKDFGEKLKQLRAKKGWSQGQVALKIGIPAERISKYENDVIFPTVDMVIKLSKTLGVTTDYLLCGDPEHDTLHQIPDQEWLKRFNVIGELPEDEQQALKMIIDGMLKKHRFEKVLENPV